MIEIDAPVGSPPAGRKAKNGKKNAAEAGRSSMQRRTQQERSAEARGRLLSPTA
ncbi:hypothetical protein [Rhizorhabdus argentea]|uniref:hypothetical protein n=1 Tax=Rhizorhabdus argentea TaxID=1387174 RepID=UPI0030EB753E